MFYTVGEIAKKLGIPASTLRYYDKEGLLPFVERSGSGIRMFKDSALEWLSVIECLKKTGMPIKGIKKFVDWCMEGDATIAQRLELIDRQRDEVLSQLAKLNETLDILNYKHGTMKQQRQPAPAEFTTRFRKVKYRPKFSKSEKS